jgi:ribulose bisphosphate carboxylase small subunit
MTKAIFEETLLTDRSIKQIRYATSQGYINNVKKVDELRAKRLKTTQISKSENSLKQAFVLDKIRNS